VRIARLEPDHGFRVLFDQVAAGEIDAVGARRPELTAGQDDGIAALASLGRVLAERE
jgi:hypothetical protein